MYRAWLSAVAADAKSELSVNPPHQHYAIPTTAIRNTADQSRLYNLLCGLFPPTIRPKTQIKRKISPKSFWMYLIVYVLHLHEQTGVPNTFNILQNLITNSDFFPLVAKCRVSQHFCYIITNPPAYYVYTSGVLLCTYLSLLNINFALWLVMM